jgi:hypothetical protein
VWQECNKSVTRVLKECDKSVTSELEGHNKSVTRALQDCEKSERCPQERYAMLPYVLSKMSWLAHALHIHTYTHRLT